MLANLFFSVEISTNKLSKRIVGFINKNMRKSSLKAFYGN